MLGTGAIGVLAALGIRNVGGQNVFPSFSASGGTNKVNRVTFGAAMHFQSIGSGPGHVPYVSYSLRSIGDNNKIVVRRILTQQSRLEQAIKGIKVPHGINKADVLKRAKSRIKERELNAQTAVVDVLDAMGEGKDPSASAAIQLLKKEILGNLIDSHSLVFQGFSKEELSRAKDAEKIKLNGAVEKVMSLVNSRSLNLSPQEDLTPKEKETIQAVMAGVEVDKMILNDLNSRSIDKIERDSQDALGAVIRLYRETDKGIHDVDHAPAQEKEHLGQIRDALVQSRDLLLSVLFELQELVPASQIEGELLRFQQAVAEIPKGMKQTLYFQMAKRIESKIGEGRKAESAVHFVHEEFSQQVKNNPDIDTITNVFYSRLTSPQRESTGKNVVLFTKEVPTPTDLIRLQQSGVHIVGVVCAEGNRGSHASIVAASFKIPFLTGVQRAGQTVNDWNEFVVAGTLVGVVGSNGVIEVNPPDRKIAELKHLQKELVVMEQVYEKERQAPCPVRILASPDSLDEIDSNEVGLFRTEYLFADSDRKPLIDGKPNPEFEEYLKSIFSNAASALSGKGLNIRIIDNQGSDDKPLSGVPQDADGAKGIHFILRDPLGREIAKQEIRAILQVYSTHPNIRVFFPLVSTPEDADEIDRLMKEVVSDLFAEKGIEFSLPPVGYMVETPAGVSNVKMLASRAAFFSIGSTDLTRAVFSLQRNDKFLDSYLSSVRPELVRSLEKVLVAASNERRGMDVALCGALASSRVFWPVAIILNEIYPMSLSVPPPMIPETKAFLRRISQEKEALNKIRSLLYSHQPDAAKITAESAKLIEKVDQNLKNERPYVEAMRRLDESEKAKLLLAVVVVIGVSSLLAMASFFPAMADAATLLSAGGSGDSGLEVFAQLFQGIGLATSIGPIVKKPTLPKRIDAFLNGLSSANSASEIFQSGIELMNSCGESGEDIKSVRNAILEKGLVNIIGEKSNTIGVKKLQRIIEIRMVLADVKKQLALWNKQRASQGFNIQNADSELATLAESWKSAPRYGGPGILNKEVQREFAPIHLMGITLLRGAIEANDPTIQKNIMGKVDSAIRGLSLVDFNSRLGTFNKEVVDLNPLIELGQSAHAQNQRVLQAVGTSALFGTDLFTPLVVAASEAIKANTFLKGILSKLGIEWNANPVGAGRSAIKLLDDKTGLFKLTLKEILGVVIAAGYAVRPTSNHKNLINEVLKDVRLHESARISKFIDRVKIITSLDGVPPEFDDKEFAFFVRDSRNFLTIFIHEKTLDAWKEKGDAFYYSAVMVMLYHEWAESFGVSHDHLVKMGLTIDGLDSLFMSGASEKDIYWEIKARGMLALTMRVPDERIINVQARTDAESVLDTLIPPGLPQGVENYVTGQAYPINADRSTYYHRVTHDLRRSLPGLADDDYNDSIRGTPDSNYETRLDSVLKQMGVNQHETASTLFELLVKERTAFFSDEGKDFTIEKDGQTSLREGKKFQADLARDILSRVFQVLRSRNSDLSISSLHMIKAELYVLHRLGGSLFLSFSRLNDADRLLSPAQRRVYQERDLAWLDQMIFVNDRGFSPVNDKQKAIANTSLSYQTLGKVGNQMVGAFAALDDSLLEESITPVIRISNDLLNTGVPLTGPQRTALREVFALARRAEVDIAVAKRVVFLLDASEGETQTTESLLAALAKRMGIDSEALISLSSARLTGSEGLFTDNTENKRTIRTFSAKALFERLSSLKISSTKVDIYSVPPTDSLAEVWDVADLDSKAGLVLRLIELWSSDVARRISSESDAYKKQLDAIKQSA